MADYFTLLRDRVTLKCRSIDRIVLQAYVPKLQTVGQVCYFSALAAKIPGSFLSRLWQDWGCRCRSHLVLMPRRTTFRWCASRKERTRRKRRVRFCRSPLAKARTESS